MTYWITLFLLFFLSFVVFPFGVTPFETPKIILFEASTLLLIVITLSRYSLKEFFENKRTYIPLFILFVLTLLHIIFHNSNTLFLGNAFRMQGVFLLWLLGLFAISSARQKRMVISQKVIFILLTLELLFAVFISGQNETRAIGTLGEPNALAASIIFLWPFVIRNNNKQAANKKSSYSSGFVSLVRRVRNNYIDAIGITISLFIIIMTGSRSGMVAVGMQFVFLFFFQIIRLSLKKTLIIVGILYLVSLLLPFLDRHTMYERRDDVWKASLMAGYEHPIIGWGFGNTEKALKKYNDRLYNTAHGYYVDSSHNIFLDWWVQGGIIGLTVLLLLIYDAFRMFIKKNEVLYLALLIGLVTAMSFNPVSIVTLIQFWWLIGQSLKSTKGKAIV